MRPPEFCLERCVEWTDGSVLWGDRFGITTATYAIIVTAQVLKHISLSAYVAELWPVSHVACT